MYNLYSEYDLTTGEDVAIGIFLVVYLAVLAIALAASFAAYVFQSLGLYEMMKKTGHDNPWLAWIPVGNLYSIGYLAEQSNLFCGKKKGSLRVILPLLQGAMLLFIPAFFVLGVGVGLGISYGASEALVLLLILAYLVFFIIAIVATVFQYVALYKIYRLFAPDNATLYLVLGIFIPVCTAIFLFVARKGNLPVPAEGELTAAL